MARLTREQSRAQTRERLLAVARQMFRTEGYVGTTLDRIAEAAGYSKGAVYANFEDKQAIFLAAMTVEGRETLDALYATLDQCDDAAAATDALAHWADTRSRDGNWALTVLEYGRVSPAGGAARAAQEAILRDNWSELGTYLRKRWPGRDIAPEMLGAMIHELAYAPAMSIMAKPMAGAMLRQALTGLLANR